GAGSPMKPSGAPRPWNGSRGSSSAGRHDPSGGRALLRPSRRDASPADGRGMVLRRRGARGGPGAGGGLRRSAEHGGLRPRRHAYRRGGDQGACQPPRAPRGPARRYAPRRVPLHRGTGARTQAHPAHGGLAGHSRRRDHPPPLGGTIHECLTCDRGGGRGGGGGGARGGGAPNPSPPPPAGGGGLGGGGRRGGPPPPPTRAAPAPPHAPRVRE